MNYILVIGLCAQFFYTARALVQWILSEKNKRIESPALFWVFSILGSTLLLVYGWLRSDFSILFGELLSFYIYIWNLKAKRLFGPRTGWMPHLLALVPVLIIVLMLQDTESFMDTFLLNRDIPIWAVLWGTLGQFIYKMRFVYQWYYSSRRHESLLPVTFWYLATIGSVLIITYGIFRLDYVLILGQLGIVASIRNIMIGNREKKLAVND